MGRRDDIDVRATRALQVVENPEFKAAFDAQRERIVNEMERLTLDGSNDSAAAALVYKLQAAKDFKAEFVRLIQAGDRAVKRAERDDEKPPFDPTDLNPTKGDE